MEPSFPVVLRAQSVYHQLMRPTHRSDQFSWLGVKIQYIWNILDKKKQSKPIFFIKNICLKFVTFPQTDLTIRNLVDFNLMATQRDSKVRWFSYFSLLWFIFEGVVVVSFI
jgi:hypothetical protein